MPDWSGGGANKGDASTNTTGAEETTAATEADTNAEGLASADTVIEIGGEGATSSESTEAG
ncbi:hypothetical protein [Streptacidiphilus anmyonensis]|uniref:hypothetical protein n=1 Tax=Streptacidiphilus anmyonensis TaxID=405782 RepID=UPI0005AA74AE|nr:hypothetical protein [Streptacidiphilus anmyonensis]